MATIKLTKRAVEAIKPEPRDVFIWDAELRGFGVRVKPSGTRIYLVQYRDADRRTRRYAIGQHGRLTAEQARGEAKALLGDIERGRNPSAERKAARAADADTVEAVAREFVARYAKPRLRTWRETQRLLDKEVLPHWGKRPLAGITRRDVIELLDAIADRGAGYTANRVMACIRKLFNWAVDRSIVDATPAARIERPGKETERNRVLTDAEIAALWAAWEGQGWPFGPLFKLLLATGQRRSEVAGMRWQDVDLDQSLWIIPREQTKSDRAHEVPLSALAIEILDGQPRMHAELVFPDCRHGRNPVSGFSKAKAITDKLVGDAAAPWRLHDLRRTAATGMARLAWIFA